MASPAQCTYQTTLVTRVSLPRYGMSLVEAQAELRVFLGNIDWQLEVCSDAQAGTGIFLAARLYKSQVAKPCGETGPPT